MKATEFIRTPIRQLPVELANQIAAGEVIERPASIVKELIENSLDAGAKSLEIEINKGGLELVKIFDDGCGIPQDELPLAVQAHCTSKISCFDDLTAIQSMGFRGEALASIASVSRFEITSRTHTQDMAWQWSNKELSNGDLKPASHPAGTSIIVRDIFYNTVARRKFLRSERTEFRHIEDVVKRIALSRFDVEIVLKHNQRVIHRLPSAVSEEQKTKRIQRLLDKNFIRHALLVSYQASTLIMSGWLSNKEYSRGQTDMQYFYVNGRMVKDKIISHALRQAYQAVLPPGRYPAYVLNLQMDPQQVDVNVHPTKHEVRFRQMRLVHDFVNHVIDKSLAELHTGKQIYEPVYAESINSGLVASLSPTRDTRVAESNERYCQPTVTSAFNKSSHTEFKSATDSSTLKKQTLLGDAIGFCQPSYLVSYAQQGMVIVHLTRIEQHMVEHQWLEQFKANKITIKPFMFPVSIELDSQLSECAEMKQELIHSLGFDLSMQTRNLALLRAAPEFLQHCQHETVIKQLLTSLQMEKQISATELIHLLSRFVELDVSVESRTKSEWNDYLRTIEKTFSSLFDSAPYKNKFWRVMSVSEINKLFQKNISPEFNTSTVR